MVVKLNTLKWFSSRIITYSFTQTKTSVNLKDRRLLCTSHNLLRANIPKVETCLVLKQYFHSSSIRRAAPLLGPALMKLMSPIYRILFLLLGRRVRKWWQRLPPEQKNIYFRQYIKNRNRLLGVLGIVGGLSTGFFIYHLEEAPTGRKRFMLLTEEQLLKIVDSEIKSVSSLLSKGQLPVYDPTYIRVYNIVKRIFEASGLDQSNLSERVNVINSDEINAFVLANGQIFVLHGMINATDNDDELAGIIGHELSHFLLNHAGEQLSRSGFINLFSIAILTVMWAIAPNDFISIFGSWLNDKIEDIMINLPYSRKLEKEADEFGMILAAKACYDVKQIPNFWERMHTMENSSEELEIDWFSTHPSHDRRVNWLNETLPKALVLREEYKCPQLTTFYNQIKTLR